MILARKNEEHHKMLQPLCDELGELEMGEPLTAKEFNKEGSSKELEKDTNVKCSRSSNKAARHAV